MPWLLNLVYALLLVCASPWLLAAALRHGKYRAGWAAKLWGQVPRRKGRRPCVWLHAVSVGEVHQLQPLLQRLAAERPGWECVITTTTQTGFALARQRYPDQQVCYCPLDFSWAVRRALRRIRPDLLVLVELELWPNLIAAASRSGARVAIVNARLSPRSFRGYRRLGRILAPTLRRVDLIAAQTDEYAERFRRLGARPESLCVTGSLKFDGVRADRSNPDTQRLIRLAGVDPAQLVLLAGSTQAPEEQLAIEAFGELAECWPELRLILVPRHPQRFEAVAELLRRSRFRWQRRSRLEDQPADPAWRILLVDTIGELAAWWGAAHIAFVGGSLGSRGGQNMIEPAGYGAAVSFGPQTHNFKETVDLLLRHEAGVVVHDGRELTAFVRRCLEQSAWRLELGDRARAVVLRQIGAADRTWKRLLPLVDVPHSEQRPPAKRPSTPHTFARNSDAHLSERVDGAREDAEQRWMG